MVKLINKVPFTNHCVLEVFLRELVLIVKNFADIFNQDRKTLL